MPKIPAHFIDGNDPSSDMPLLGFEANGMFIHDPFMSSCSRFQVDPTEEHGISKEDADLLKNINDAIEHAAEDALNAGCLAVQTALGVTDGGFAGVYFSDDKLRNHMAAAFRDYLRAEQAQVADEEDGEGAGA